MSKYNELLLNQLQMTNMLQCIDNLQCRIKSSYLASQ